MESRIPFEYVHEDHLRSLDRFAVLVLPTGLCLSDEAVEAITSFADGGGAVVGCCGALGEDEWGGPRRLDVVRRLLGVEYAESLIGPLKHACIEVDEGDLFGGLGDTDIIGGGRWIRAVEAARATEASFQGAWIPDYPVAPTQDVVLPDPRRDVPLLSAAPGPGGAAALYLAADLDASYGRHENPDHGRILTNAVRKALGGRGLSVEVRGAGVVDVRPWRQEGSALVFLVNLDNARMQGGAVRELRPLGPLEVMIRLAPGETAHTVRLLRQDTECVWQQEGRELVATVPSVVDFELIVVDVR
jgi:hypothetical protein